MEKMNALLLSLLFYISNTISCTSGYWIKEQLLAAFAFRKNEFNLLHYSSEFCNIVLKLYY